MLKSLSPIDVALIKKIGGNGSSYTLPIASSAQLGGVQPAARSDEMTQAVGVDEAGALWTAAGGSNSIVKRLLFSGSVKDGVNFSISDDYRNYDYLLVTCIVSGKIQYPYTSIIVCSDVVIGGNYYGTTALESANTYNSCAFQFKSETTIRPFMKSAGWPSGTVSTIWGIKL